MENLHNQRAVPKFCVFIHEMTLCNRRRAVTSVLCYSSGMPRRENERHKCGFTHTMPFPCRDPAVALRGRF
jgi:hypothetical protein